MTRPRSSVSSGTLGSLSRASSEKDRTPTVESTAASALVLAGRPFLCRSVREPDFGSKPATAASDSSLGRAPVRSSARINVPAADGAAVISAAR